MALIECRSTQLSKVERLIVECLRARRGSFVGYDELCLVAFGIFSDHHGMEDKKAVLRALFENPAVDEAVCIVPNADWTAFKID